MAYDSQDGAGLTDRQGRYRAAGEVVFRIGDIELGRASAAEYLTPAEFFDLSGSDDPLQTPAVVNVIRLLQTLDVDGDVRNGIAVDEVARDAGLGRSLDFDQPVADFEADARVIAFLCEALRLRPDAPDCSPAPATAPLVPTDTARGHFAETLDHIDASDEPNLLPDADAGADREATAGETVVLAGFGGDPDGEVAAYEWEQGDAGPRVGLDDADTAEASFVAPQVDATVRLTFRLAVTDDDGAIATDGVTVTLFPAGGDNAAPTAGDLSLVTDEDDPVSARLDGEDTDGDALTYTILDRPGNGSVELADDGIFTYTPAAGFSGEDAFTYRADDGRAQSNVATVDILVREGGGPSNETPVADAGPDRTLDEGTPVTLDGRDSFDPDGEIAGYAWEQTAGAPVTLDDPQAPAPSFTAPQVDMPLATLVFRLTVTDDEGATGTATVRVFVRDVPVGRIRVGAAKRDATPQQAHIDGVEEPRIGGATHLQKFNLGGFGIDPTQNLPDPFGSIGESLTQSAEERVHVNDAGEPERTWVRVMLMDRRNEDDSVTRLAFVTLDAIGAGNVIQDGVKAAVAGAVGVPETNVLFGQTHTHAGADLQGLWGGVPQVWIDDPAERDGLYQKAAAAAREAEARLRPVDLEVRAAELPEFNNYRRPRLREDADADHTATLLRALDGEGDVVASILQYNAHPTSINEDPRVPHADYVLGALDYLEEPANGGGVALYFNGPIADASPSGPTEGDDPYERVRSRGEGIAAGTLSRGEPRPLGQTLVVRHQEVVLPVTNPLFLAGGVLGSFNRYYDFRSLPLGEIPGLGDALGDSLANLPQVTATATTTVSRITIGGADGGEGLEIVTIPGETTNSFGEYIQHLAGTQTMLLGLTQDSYGYILPEEEFSYLDLTGDAGFLLPFTSYEEYVSLGPLTAPLLRLQGYQPLFDAAPGEGLSPALAACAGVDNGEQCLLGDLFGRLDRIQGFYGDACRENLDADNPFCLIVDPPTPEEGLAAQCAEAGLPDAICGLIGVLEGLVPGDGGEPGDPSDEELAVETAGDALRGCDPIDPAHCLFPFPNDHFTRADEATATGLRLALNPLAMPRNLLGKPIDPTEWNRNDGFSPGPMILAYAPGVDLARSGAVPLTDLNRYTDPDQPVLLIDAETGERQPVWAEIDVNAGQLIPAEGIDKAGEAKPALIVRPARNLTPGRRYIVALRHLRDAAGESLAAPAAFRVCRDGVDTGVPVVADRCASLEDDVFAPLADHGVARDDLYLAWDFTVASDRSLTGRLLHMRDDAFAALGERGDPGDPDYEMGAAPTVTVDEVINNPDEKIARRVVGRITMPSYLAPSDAALLNQPALTDLVSQVGEQFPDELELIGEGLDIATILSVPPNRLYYSPFDGSAGGIGYGDGLPDRLYPGATQDAEFICSIPKAAVGDFASATAADVTPARPSLYGHGLLGSHTEVRAGNVEAMGNEHNMMFCAIDWFGFATGDVPNVLLSLLDLSLFPVIPDASQQGMLNQLFLARALRHPEGLAANPAFQVDGRPVFDNREVFYDGNSQGGILGGPVVALSKDIDRGVLGVPGMNYSLLLRRSVDFDTYAIPLYLSYQGDLDRNLGFSLIQMLWDRSENNGYVHRLNRNPFPGTGENRVLLHPAYGDHQVTMWSADIMARSMDAPIDRSRVPDARHPAGENAFSLLDEVDYGADGRADGSAIVYWDAGPEATPPPPVTNTPPRAGEDPHSYPRDQVPARCQKSHFLHPEGAVVDVTGVTAAADCPALPAIEPPPTPEPPDDDMPAELGSCTPDPMAEGCVLNSIADLLQADTVAGLVEGLAACAEAGEGAPECVAAELREAVDIAACSPKLTAPDCPVGNIVGDVLAVLDDLALPVASDEIEPTPARGESRAGNSYAIYLPSESGEIIAFQVFEPAELAGGERYPLVLHGHGFGGSRMTEASGTVARLLEAGYGVISVDQRGFGESSGTVRVMDPDYEGRDLVQILDWAEAHLDWLAYEADNLVLGAIGGSYGGGYQLLLQGADPENRLDAMVPDITWNDLRYSLNPGGVVKSGWALVLVAGGEAGAQLQLDPFIKETLLQGILTNRFPEDSLAWFNYHSLDYFCRVPGDADQGVYPALPPYPGATAPRRPLPDVDVLLTQGMRDTLFNFNEAYRNFSCLERETAGDVRLMTHESGHILPLSADTVPGLSELDSQVLAEIGLNLPAFQEAGGSRACGALDLGDATLAWFKEKLKGVDGAAAALGGPDETCLSLAEGDAVRVDEVPVGGTEVDVPPTRNVPVGVAGAAGSVYPPRAVELGMVGPGGDVLAGIPRAQLTVTYSGGVGDADAILFAGIGVRGQDEAEWRLVDDQIMPLRGLGDHDVSLVGVGERLHEGDRVALLLYGYHLQYLESASRDPRLLSVDVEGRVSLPLLDGNLLPMPTSLPTNGGGLLGLVTDTLGDLGETVGVIGGLLGVIEDPEALPDEVLAALEALPVELGDTALGLFRSLVGFAGLDGDGPLGAALFDTYANVAGLLDTIASDPTQFPPDLAATVGELVDDSGNIVGLGEDAVAREVEPVVLTGARIPAWSAPAAFGYPDNPLPAPLAEDVRDAHDGTLIAPESPIRPEGVPVDEVAAYRWADGAWVEIPVQVDERFPYFLSNDNSDFGVYSGTDTELTYAWDEESWKKTDTRVVTLPDGRVRYETAYPPGEGATPDPVPGLDDDDEIVFMASDAGGLAPSGERPAGERPAGVEGEGRLVTLVDPLDPDELRHVYLFRRPGGSSFTAENGYVRYDRHEDADEWIDRHFFRADDPEKLGSSNTGYGANLAGPVRPPEDGYFDYQRAGCDPDAVECLSEDRFPRDGLTVTTDRYRWEASGRWMVRDIRIAKPGQPGVYGPDLIDRWKGRAFQQTPDSDISLVGFEDEQVNWEANASLLGERCGPVRCIRETWGADSGTNVTKTETFYRDAIAYRYRVRVHPIPPDGLYTNWDYNRGVAARYYNALRPDGVAIDGRPDDVLQIDEIGLPGCNAILETLDALSGFELPDYGEEDISGCATFFDFPDPTFNLPLGYYTWEQVSGRDDAGSLVYLFELKGPTTVVNPLIVPYYRDDACFDDGTGDDPVPRPWPGEASDDPRVAAGYEALAGRPIDTGPDAPFEDCIERQGAHASHGVHILVLAESDNLFTGMPVDEIDGQQWQFMVPTERPDNIGEPYANTVRVPLQPVVTPLVP
ncbi:hypothetical protein PC39_08384 [Salinisphaera sp. PC39]